MIQYQYMNKCIDCKNIIGLKSLRCRTCSKMGSNNPLWKRPRSEDFKKNHSIFMMAENNPMWKGDKVGKSALHEWIGKRLKKTKFCNDCKTEEPIDLANISQEYKRDIKDWEWLCRGCHMAKDGRLFNLIKNGSNV